MIFATGEERIDLPHLPTELLNSGPQEARRNGGDAAGATPAPPAPPSSPPPADAAAAGRALVLPGDLPERGFDMKATIAQWEREWVAQALTRTGGNQSAAARLLGLTRDELRYRVDKFVLEPAA